MIILIWRTALMYLMLILTMRLTGKRQIGELQLSELITTLMLSELAVRPIAEPDTPLSHALLPIATLLALEWILSALASHSPQLRRLLYGAPSILICRGRIDRRELRRLRMDISELAAELRLKDTADMADVDYAILEDNGKLSVFKKSDDDSAGISIPVIMHGQIMQKALCYAGIDEQWLFSHLAKHGLSLDAILLASVDAKRRLTYVLNGSGPIEIQQTS